MFSAIVVGTDGSETAHEAVKQATELAQTLGASIHLVSAYEPVPDSRLREERQEVPEDLQWMVNPREDVNTTLEEAETELKEAGIDVQTHAREGDPADAILDVAEEQKADLIVVGNKGMTGAKRFLLGSVPNKVSHHAPCSVMIIRTTCPVLSAAPPRRRRVRGRSGCRSRAGPGPSPLSPAAAPPRSGWGSCRAPSTR